MNFLIIFFLIVLVFQNGKCFIIHPFNDEPLESTETEDLKLVKTLEGHTAGITSLITLENSFLVSGSRDNTIKIWDVKEGICVHTLEGHTGYISALLQLRNGYLASGSSDKTIKIWDPTNGRLIRTLEGHESIVLSLAELQNDYLVSEDYKVKIWNTHDGSLKTYDDLMRMPGYTDFESEVIVEDFSVRDSLIFKRLFIFDKRYLARGSVNGRILIFEDFNNNIFNY